MKKTLLLILTLCLFTVPALADDSLPAQAVALAARMDRLAGEDAYLEAVIGSGSSGNPIVNMARNWAAEDHEKPSLMAHADTSDLFSPLQGLLDASGGDTLSNEAQMELQRKMPLSLPSLVNGSLGAEILAASSACHGLTTFASDASGSGMYILLYGNATPVMAAWRAENGAVLMQAFFVPDEGLASCKTLDDVTAWLESKTLTLACEAIEIP